MMAAEKLIYHMVPIDTMNTQLNLRLPKKMLNSAKRYSEEHGFSTVQEFIKETLREKLFEDISSRELALVKKLAEVSDKKDLYGTEEELRKKLRRK